MKKQLKNNKKMMTTTKMKISDFKFLVFFNIFTFNKKNIYKKIYFFL